MPKTKYGRTIMTMIAAAVIIGATAIHYSLSIPPKRPEAIFQYVETLMVKNNGSQPIEFGGISTETFLDFTWQKPRIVYVNHNYQISKDRDGNPLILIEGPPQLAPNDTYTITIVCEIESFQREIPEVSIMESGNLSDIPYSLVNYTREVAPWRSPPTMRLDTAIWNNTQYYNMTLQEIATELKGDSQNVLEMVLSDIRWISDSIRYDSAAPTYPIETAMNRKGDCDDQSNLLIALLRLQGIPSFLMLGQVYLPMEEYENFTDTAMDGHLFYETHYTMGHAWAMVYIPPWGWLPCDPVVANPDYPLKYAITEAFVKYPITLVFKNITGVNEAEAADYIGSSREETRMAEEEELYFWLIQDMRQTTLSLYVIILRSPIFILYAEAVCSAAAILIVGIYDKRRTRLLEAYQINICLYCRAENLPDAVYCGHCGQRIKRSRD